MPERKTEAMGMLIIRHKVKDYGEWRPMFDKHSLMQQAAGLSNPRVFRSADDKSEIVVVFDTKDTKRAKDFARFARPQGKRWRKRGSWTTRRSFFLNRSS